MLRNKISILVCFLALALLARPAYVRAGLEPQDKKTNAGKQASKQKDPRPHRAFRHLTASLPTATRPNEPSTTASRTQIRHENQCLMLRS